MDILGKPLKNIQALIEKKELASKEVQDYFLNRSKKYNKDLNAYITINEAADSETSLLAIKDNFCTKGLRTTASSKILDSFIPPYNATVIKRLRDAGFGFIGKTNMDAWAHGSSTETSDYGPTRNPWDLSKSPGGSSGGSAAAVSAYMAPAAIGSETAGSIRQPASWSGVIGLKPTYGRVSRYGVVAMGSSFDCPGPMTNSVADAAHLLKIIAGHDAFDATSSHEPVPDYEEFVKEKKKFTIGITDEYFEGVDDEVKEKVMQSIKILEKLGHTIKKISLISPKYSISTYTILQRAEVSSNLARYTGIRYGKDRSFFGDEAKKRIMLGAYTLSHGYYDEYYKTAQKVRTLIIEDFKQVFKDVDFIVSPTTPMTALKIGDSKKYSFFGEAMDVLNEPAAVAGIPAISFPVGLDKSNMPIGMQLMGNYFQEANILNLAYQFESETNFFSVISDGFQRYR